MIATDPVRFLVIDQKRFVLTKSIYFVVFMLTKLNKTVSENWKERETNKWTVEQYVKSGYKSLFPGLELTYDAQNLDFGSIL